MSPVFRLIILAFPLLVATGCAPLVVGGAASGVLMAEDRRSAGTYILDEEIEWKASHRTNEAKLTNIHVNFTSYNRRVLITGEIPSENLKNQVNEIIRGIPDVRDIVNEAVIAAPTSLVSRSNDTLLTTRVKAHLFDDRRFNANHIKVITENGVVYLMGIVNKVEGTAAAEVASKTGGITRVITVFEYIN